MNEGIKFFEKLKIINALKSSYYQKPSTKKDEKISNYFKKSKLKQNLMKTRFK